MNVKIISDKPLTLSNPDWSETFMKAPASLSVAGMAALLTDPNFDAVVVCNQSKGGTINKGIIERFLASGDDIWHAGSGVTDLDDEDFLVYVEPLLNYRPTPASNLDIAVSWRISPVCFLVRSLVFVKNGSALNTHYDSMEMFLAGVGFGLLRNGGVVRQKTELAVTGSQRSVHRPVPGDVYSFVADHYNKNTSRYILLRRMLAGKNWSREVAGFESSKGIQQGSIQPIYRDLADATLPEDLRVSIVLPTYGRYRYLKEVLGDIRHQTIVPFQILIADGNEQTPENESFYNEFEGLPMEVIWLKKEGICFARNQCLERCTGNYIWIVDDDSRLEKNNLENHLRLLGVYGADVSVGPAYTRERPQLVDSQKKVSCTFMDCGTTLLKTSLVEKAGGFDMQYNNYLANEDGEFGIRMVKQGALMLNNPGASRFHYLAPVGGARTSKNNLHRWKRWALSPRPVQSVPYTGMRHFSKKATREATVIAWFLIGRKKKKGSVLWNTGYVIAELLALPLSVYRLARSFYLAKEMMKSNLKEPYFNFRKP